MQIDVVEDLTDPLSVTAASCVGQDEWMDGVARVNLTVTEVERDKQIRALFGDGSMPPPLDTAVMTFWSGMKRVLHQPEFAGQIAGSTVADIDLPSGELADDSLAFED